MSGATDEVRHDAASSRFVLTVEGHEAELRYRKRADRLVLIHTEVPEALAGRGIGGRLVHAAVDQARADHLTLVPLCPFARRWLTDHPDAADGVAIDWQTQPPGAEDARTPRRAGGPDYESPNS
jgi:predicted GNAT family acetyltransferase